MTRIYRHLIFPITYFLVFSWLLTSCSKSDYLNVIPRESTALVSFDVQALPLIQSVHGIDIQNKVYLFESPDGNLGLCAKVASQEDITKWVGKLSKLGLCTPVQERRGYSFTTFKDSWVVGYSDKALLMMGPAMAGAQAELQQQMAKYLSQDEEAGIKNSPLYDKLDSISARIAMVAQAQALPEKFVAPFMLGAPKDADASQVLLAAKMDVRKGHLNISGETFSFNKKINTAIQEARRVYRPIQGDYKYLVARQSPLTILMNVDGKEFLPLIQQNKGLQALLMGLNTAIDMDNIIRAIDGDMAMTVNTMTENGLSMGMGARLSNFDFIKDVDYWKQSCPPGARIVDWKQGDMKTADHHAYQYTDGKTNFYFGVRPERNPVFYSGTDEKTALEMLYIPTREGPETISVERERMVMIVRLADLLGSQDGETSLVANVLKPLFGNVSTIVYKLQ